MKPRSPPNSSIHKGTGVEERGEEGMSWQPIESAPKDGTEVLLFTDSARMPRTDARFYRTLGIDHFTAIQIGYWEDATDAPLGRHVAGWAKLKIGEPTHWQPLPDPPKESV
jgi:hypothetical protein